MAFEFQVILNCSNTSARAGVLSTPHGPIETPVFMPVGTKATVKAMTPEELDAAGAQIILANTFHLALRPGSSVVKALGGLHKMMNWNKPILTDSGGFQVFSLSKLNKIQEDGVRFRSPIDGSEMFLSPEIATKIQHELGADIIMAFDECAPYPAEHDYVRRSAEMTIRWAERCRETNRGYEDEQALFGIVQGGIYPDLREWSAHRTVDLDFPGYAIGGLSVGETKPEMEAALDVMNANLPENKPRYLMGVGTPDDFFRAVERGVDMFDCVLPTRSARTGRIYTSDGIINMRNAVHTTDTSPMDCDCGCYACRHYTRGYIRHLFMSDEILASRLATSHNLYYFLHLMQGIRQAITADRFPAYKAEVLGKFHQKSTQS